MALLHVREFIADAPYGHQKARVRLVGLDAAAQLSRPTTLSATSPRAVSIRIGTSRFSEPRLIARQTAIPSSPGIIRSMTIKSYGSASVLASASRPLPVASQV